MRRLSFIILLIFIASIMHAQSPHGAGFKMDCAECHTTAGWKVEGSNIKFDHNSTAFALAGQHRSMECRQCHSTLKFSEAGKDCSDCHTDIHKNSVGSDCAKCHTPQTWLVLNVNQIHQKSRFPLLGVHINLDCAQCHEGYSELRFEVHGISCYDCHSKDYLAAKNPDHATSNFSTECQTCHSISSNTWSASDFNHDFFPLTGGHKISNCFSCHTPGNFAGLSKDCYACHKTTFEAAANPNHISAGFGTSCTECHNISGWKPSAFDHSTTGFTLSGAHLSRGCNDCHSSGFKGTSADCYSCHKTDYESAKDPNHLDAKFPTTCGQCHTTSVWKPANFDHSITNFPLTGKHTAVACASCHTGGYSGTSTDCYSCHKSNYESTTNPDHKAASFSTSCADCHTTNGWQPATFDHDGKYFPIYSGSHRGKWNLCSDCHTNSGNFAEFSCITCHEHNKTSMDDEHGGVSGYQYVSSACYACHQTGSASGAFNHSASPFPLVGTHATVSCEDCHKGTYTNTPSDCNSCHNQKFTSTTSPNHVLIGMPTDCSQCHTPTAWSPSSFNHSATAFVLTGVHLTTNCESCHQGKTTGTAQQCYGCHKSNFDATTNPNHLTSNFPTVCETCHSTTAWSPASYNHDLTKFPLTGKHVSVACEQCHTSGYTGTSMLCSSCHTTDFNNTTDPNHSLIGMANTCETCHTTSGWTPSSFDHSGTSFVLTGVHLTTKCESCHQGKTTGTTQQCYGCHKSNFDATTNPNHVSSGFPTTCEQCHTTSAWSPATFDHNLTKFPLTGKHVTVTCQQCHTSGYTGTSTECSSCHTTDFNNSTNPSHTAVGISKACSDCHNTSGWTPSSFNHSSTAFVLTGVHLTTKCESCHLGKTTGTTQQCYGCHKSNFDATTNPNHVSSGFPTTCEQCHTTSTWSSATLDHNLTKFPLTGKHVNVSCEQCHTSGYTGTSMLCSSCHTTDFNNTTNPNHSLIGMANTCETCHTTSGWTPSSFDHSGTSFVLTGVHLTTKCESCHQGKTTGTTQQCYGCHKSNFDATTNPNHVSSGFPTTCEQCHTTSAWSPATFDHNLTKFPLTGKHVAVTCQQCHTSGYTGTSMLCSSCHITDFNNTTDPSHSLIGMANTCETCHTTSGWTPSSFDHSGTAFVLTGVHLTTKCESCHLGKTTGTTQQCYGCHKSNFDATTNPNHVSSGFPTTCEQCHTTGAWSPATFDHNLTKFPLTGKHVTVTCQQCHTSGYTGTPTECSYCHTTDFNNSTNPSHTAVGISKACSDCHNTSGWTPSSFNHSSTAFVLTGVHITTKCESCHKGQTTGTSALCNSCHNSNFTATLNPSHVLTGISTECAGCHTTSGWTPSTFNHSTTAFVLSGAHLNTRCESCHQGKTTGTTQLCYGCHKSNFDATTNPNHVSSSFPTTCEQCHTTSAWSPATFDHNLTKFPLTGRHTSVACSQCHASGYTNTPTACYSCHSTDFNGTTNPNHTAANFPTACEQCHTTSGWTPATFDHDGQYFPIYSGNHKGEWNTCADCHLNQNDYSSFSCINCHEHSNKSEVDSDHRGVANYVYTSQACYNCHPTGRKG